MGNAGSQGAEGESGNVEDHVAKKKNARAHLRFLQIDNSVPLDRGMSILPMRKTIQ